MQAAPSRRIESRLLLLVALLSAAHSARTQESAKAPSRPNVVLVMADDQGWGDVAARGHPHLVTPTLDALHKGAVRFERFYAAAPVCSPTRGSCLTGRHPSRYRIRGANDGHLPKGERNLAQRLGRLGYRCGHFGKWHLGTLSKTVVESNRGGPRGAAHYAPPWERGFERVFATEAKVPTFDPMMTPPRWAGGVGKKKPGSKYGTHYWTGPEQRVDFDELRGDDSALIVERAKAFIADCAAKSEPFFVVVWFHAPHLPVLAGERDLEPYAELELNDKTRHYYGCMTALDRALGSLRKELRDRGVADDTLLWYCSDNGPEGRNARAPGQNGGLRGRKRSLYEGGIRVPAYLEWPRRFKEAKVIRAPVCTSDFVPTILALLGHSDQETRFDGIDVTPLLTGERKTRDRAIGFASRRQAAWTEDRYKLVRVGKRVELYDLQADRRESKDLAATKPERRDKMLAALDAWLADCKRDADRLQTTKR